MNSHQAEQIEQFVDALCRDPNVAPPPGLDPEITELVRALVQSERGPTPERSLQDRVWLRVQLTARIRLASNGHESSSSGLPACATTRENEEMNQTIVMRPRRMDRHSWATSLTLAAAAAAAALFVVFLLLHRDQPDSTPGAGPGLMEVTPVPTPEQLANVVLITPGDTIHGTLTAGSPGITYTLSVEEPTSVAVFGLSRDFILALSTAVVNGMSGSAGSGGGGPYTLPVMAFAVMDLPGHAQGTIAPLSLDPERTTGDYILSTQALAADVNLAYGETVDGQISPDKPFQVFAFEGQGGEVVSLNVDGTPDSQMILFTSLDVARIMSSDTSLVLAFDSDSGAGLNPEINNFVLPVDGLYYVAVVIADTDQAGSFRLRLDLNRRMSLGAEVPENAVPLEIGQTVEGALTVDQPGMTYTFSVEQQTAVAVFALSHDFGPNLSEMVTTESGGGGGGGGGGGPVVLPATAFTVMNVPDHAQGWIMVQSEQGEKNTLGSFILSTQVLPAAATLGVFDVEPTSFPSFQLGPDQPFEVLAFEGRAGDVIDLRVYSATPDDQAQEIDTEMYLIDSQGVSYGWDDDSGAGLNPEINGFEVPQDGLYYVAVAISGRDQAGSVIVSAVRRQPGSCNVPSTTTAGTQPETPPLQTDYTITQDFSPEHGGIDLAVPVDTPVYAAGGGTVVFSGWSSSGSGTTVVIVHGDTRSLYSHLDQALVTCGEEVMAGQPIALSGSTGNVTGPSLHFEIQDASGQPVDPRSYQSF